MMRRLGTCLLAAMLLLFCCSHVLANSDPEQANLIYNGDFQITSEQDDLPGGWIFDAWAMGDESEFGQQRSGQDNCVYVNNFLENDARICQEVPVEPDSYYEITCRIKTSGVAGDMGATVSVLDTYASSESITGTNDWQQVILRGVTGEDQTSLTIALRVGGYGALATGQAWFDDVYMRLLTEQPEGMVASFGTLEPGDVNLGGGSVFSQVSSKAEYDQVL